MRGGGRYIFDGGQFIKYKMSNIQAAIGCAQMLRANELVERKREILKTYKEEFLEQEIDHYAFNPEQEDCSIGAWMTTVIMARPSSNSDLSAKLQTKLRSCGIDARPFFEPLSRTPAFQNESYRVNTCKWANSIPQVALNLPCSHEITRSEIKYVAKIIKQALC